MKPTDPQGAGVGGSPAPARKKLEPSLGDEEYEVVSTDDGGEAPSLGASAASTTKTTGGEGRLLALPCDHAVGCPVSRPIRVCDVGKLDRVIRTGELEIDVKNFLVLVAGEPLELSLRQFLLLAALAARPGRTLSRKELVAALWDDGDAHAARTVDVNVQRLRAALSRRSSHHYVHTVRRYGYRLVPPGHEDAAAKAHPRASDPEALP
jgi:DNA-binding winged helix-turn-helix (wHTH) protein